MGSSLCLVFSIELPDHFMLAVNVYKAYDHTRVIPYTRLDSSRFYRVNGQRRIPSLVRFIVPAALKCVLLSNEADGEMTWRCPWFNVSDIVRQRPVDP